MAVGEAMEKQWFGRYIAYLTAGEDEPEEKDTEKKEDKKPVCREHTVRLMHGLYPQLCALTCSCVASKYCYVVR